jgi:DNA-binding NarL/FixJ family response regulator
LVNLFRLEKDFEVVARCMDGLETMKAVSQHRPDILILDIRMPAKNGLEIAKEMLNEKLPTRVVLPTAALDEEELVEAVHLGVQGILLKEMAPQFLVQCIRKVSAREQWIERDSTRRALEKMLQGEAAAREIADLLTPREIDIVRMVAKGLRNKEIGDRLCVSEGTVKVHLHNIYDKLKVDGRLALRFLSRTLFRSR